MSGVTLGSRWRSIRTGLEAEVTRVEDMGHGQILVEVLMVSPRVGDDVNNRLPVSFGLKDFQTMFESIGGVGDDVRSVR